MQVEIEPETSHIGESLNIVSTTEMFLKKLIELFFLTKKKSIFFSKIFFLFNRNTF